MKMTTRTNRKTKILRRNLDTSVLWIVSIPTSRSSKHSPVCHFLGLVAAYVIHYCSRSFPDAKRAELSSCYHRPRCRTANAADGSHAASRRSICLDFSGLFCSHTCCMIHARYMFSPIFWFLFLVNPPRRLISFFFLLRIRFGRFFTHAASFVC